MNDAGPSNSPGPARRIGATDEQLSAELRKWTGATPALHPVGELLDRHWEAASAYARLCTDGPRSAGILTTAAFTRIFGETLRQTGPTSAWRPHLLVTVRRIAAEWATDHRRDMLHPELLSGAGEGERVSARLLPQQHRRLLSGAFQRLPQSARCLLWHVEVEAEPLAAPAGLLGLDEEGARVELDRARDRLREESLQLHRELAPDEECRRYLRLLDVTYRRGGLGIDPDLRAHIQGCGHCAAAADQLGRFNHGLGLALAEAVLGWGGLEYAESRSSGVADNGVTDVPRPGTETAATGPGAETAAAGAGLTAGVAGGEAFPDPVVLAGMAGESFTDPVGPPAAPAREKTAHAHDGFPAPPDAPPAGGTTPGRRVAGSRTAARRSAHKAARRTARRRNLTVSILTVSGLVVIPLVLWSLGNSGEGPQQAGAGRPSETPGSGAGEPTGDPSWVGSGDAEKGALRGRLHNVDSGLCVGVEGAKAVEDAEAELTPCSSAAAQQWTYETDGLLRNGAAPGLCLDSHLGYSVRLAPCTGASQPDSRNIRYDFTLQGALVPRWNQDLALAPAATDGSGALVLKTRADDEDQRWAIDTSKADLQMEAVNWHAAAPAPRPTPTPTPTPSKTPTATPTPSATPSAARPTPTGAAPTDSACDRYGYPCDGDGQYGYPGYGYPGYGYPGYGYPGYGYGYGGYGGGRR
ncbi:DNA-directed RNA polymerase specialized sigma24 family protein [Streptomyces africanus]|uniref:DNA-directed RNA polymerase specialized sigma24 family protein n=1 Tax=Streptomyces africanus TaxID=231024 RepID=A0ABU0QFY2_9ACTN|nr:ricin-type beta-trefoil lectin domain protein [Streptomyces africanus]MDQ0746282.1 DNA-directed RNA polymerase specialized sigma24 family protein [Streptomyces africanus]